VKLATGEEEVVRKLAALERCFRLGEVAGGQHLIHQRAKLGMQVHNLAVLLARPVCTTKRPLQKPPTSSRIRSDRLARTACPARSSAASSIKSRNRGSALGSAAKIAATSSTLWRGRLISTWWPVSARHSSRTLIFQRGLGSAAVSGMSPS
jgi:hypothetical protein